MSASALCLQFFQSLVSNLMLVMLHDLATAFTLWTGASPSMVFHQVSERAEESLDQWSLPTRIRRTLQDCVPDGSDKLFSSQVIALPSPDQCQQLISLLQSQLAVAPPSATSSSTHPSTSASQITHPPTHNQSPFTGTTLFSPYIAAISSPSPLRILDTGATHHVCCDLALFLNSAPVTDTFVNLPNGTKANVTHMGSIVLCYVFLASPSISSLLAPLLLLYLVQYTLLIIPLKSRELLRGL